jgi:hypothetical protein
MVDMVQSLVPLLVSCYRYQRTSTSTSSTSCKTTLRCEGIESSLDEFPPHSVDLNKIDAPSAEFFNMLDLKVVRRLSDRVLRV